MGNRGNRVLRGNSTENYCRNSEEIGDKPKFMNFRLVIWQTGVEISNLEGRYNIYEII